MIGLRQSPQRHVGRVHQVGEAAGKNDRNPRPLLADYAGQLEPVMPGIAWSVTTTSTFGAGRSISSALAAEAASMTTCPRSSSIAAVLDKIRDRHPPPARGRNRAADPVPQATSRVVAALRRGPPAATSRPSCRRRSRLAMRIAPPDCADQPMHHRQAKPGPLADALGGEERFGRPLQRSSSMPPTGIGHGSCKHTRRSAARPPRRCGFAPDVRVIWSAGHLPASRRAHSARG